MSVKAIEFQVTGRVQGVGFRDAARARALALGVTGWVRNRPDGAVEGVAQGSDEQLRRFVEWLSRGPAAAGVSRVGTTPTAARSRTSFDIIVATW